MFPAAVRSSIKEAVAVSAPVGGTPAAGTGISTLVRSAIANISTLSRPFQAGP